MAEAEPRITCCTVCKIIGAAVIIAIVVTVCIIVAIYFYSPSKPEDDTLKNRRILLNLFRGKDIGFGSVTSTQYHNFTIDLNKLVPKHSIFQNFNKSHSEAIHQFTKKLLEQPDATCLMRYANHFRNSINREVWINGIIRSTQRAPFMKNLSEPALVQLFPDRFIHSEVITESTKPENQGKCTVDDGVSGSNNGIENQLWYFREDVMVNAQHWCWHVEYPWNDTRKRPDRRGEMFYILHYTILARYNAERLSNKMSMVTPLELKNESAQTIEEFYYPHLTEVQFNKSWPDRPPKSTANFSDLYTWHRNIVKAIQSGSLNILSLEDGDNQYKSRSLVNNKGIDILADVVEATVYYNNSKEYGIFHNEGHDIISKSGNAKDDTRGVMGDTSTALRDVIFYRWHALINGLFDLHKKTLPPYESTGKPENFPLVWTGVQVQSLSVNSDSQLNRLTTFWANRTIDISHGLDFNDTTHLKPVNICIKHLDHEEFEYNIIIRREATVSTGNATVRIFLAPRYNLDESRFNMEEQRGLFFMLDVFEYTLEVGENGIQWKSSYSDITRNWSKTIEELEVDLNDGKVDEAQCGCGWPHHLLLPKGQSEGMIYDLFVMVTNRDEESVKEPGTTDDANLCYQPYSYCGILDEKYPDKRPMGYPFDRTPPFRKNSKSLKVSDLDQFVELIPNSKYVQVTITHVKKEQ